MVHSHRERVCSGQLPESAQSKLEHFTDKETREIKKAAAAGDE
ncbi:hypothetical protein [Nostoc linckia]|nr:hypothetical protein [Nostoc linckia]